MILCFMYFKYITTILQLKSSVSKQETNNTKENNKQDENINSQTDNKNWNNRLLTIAAVSGCLGGFWMLYNLRNTLLDMVGFKEKNGNKKRKTTNKPENNKISARRENNKKNKTKQTLKSKEDYKQKQKTRDTNANGINVVIKENNKKNKTKQILQSKKDYKLDFIECEYEGKKFLFFPLEKSNATAIREEFTKIMKNQLYRFSLCDSDRFSLYDSDKNMKDHKIICTLITKNINDISESMSKDIGDINHNITLEKESELNLEQKIESLLGIVEKNAQEVQKLSTTIEKLAQLVKNGTDSQIKNHEQILYEKSQQSQQVLKKTIELMKEYVNNIGKYYEQPITYSPVSYLIPTTLIKEIIRLSNYIQQVRQQNKLLVEISEEINTFKDQKIWEPIKQKLTPIIEALQEVEKGENIVQAQEKIKLVLEKANQDAKELQANTTVDKDKLLEAKSILDGTHSLINTMVKSSSNSKQIDNASSKQEDQIKQIEMFIKMKETISQSEDLTPLLSTALEKIKTEYFNDQDLENIISNINEFLQTSSKLQMDTPNTELENKIKALKDKISGFFKMITKKYHKREGALLEVNTTITEVDKLMNAIFNETYKSKLMYLNNINDQIETIIKIKTTNLEEETIEDIEYQQKITSVFNKVLHDLDNIEQAIYKIQENSEINDYVIEYQTQINQPIITEKIIKQTLERVNKFAHKNSVIPFFNLQAYRFFERQETPPDKKKEFFEQLNVEFNINNQGLSNKNNKRLFNEILKHINDDRPMSVEIIDKLPIMEQQAYIIAKNIDSFVKSMNNIKIDQINKNITKHTSINAKAPNKQYIQIFNAQNPESTLTSLVIPAITHQLVDTSIEANSYFHYSNQVYTQSYYLPKIKHPFNKESIYKKQINNELKIRNDIRNIILYFLYLKNCNFLNNHDGNDKLFHISMNNEFWKHVKDDADYNINDLVKKTIQLALNDMNIDQEKCPIFLVEQPNKHN